MEFGIFHSAHVPQRGLPPDQLKALEHQRLMEEVELCVAAEKAGFKYSWFTEHHFLEEYSHISASEVFMGFCAARTERIHLGSGIFNLTPPVNPPARVAERVAMLDHLSEGRFELGIGRGSSTTEFLGFGIPDADTTREMMDEALPEILRMWRDERYSYEGTHFAMPERRVLPRLYTDPHPPLWIAAGSPSTFEKAARLGMGVLCFTIGPPAQLEPLIEVYKKTIAKAEPVGDYVNDAVLCVSQLVCAEDDEVATDEAMNMGHGYYQSLVFRWLDTFPHPPEVPVWPDLVPEPTPETLGWMRDNALITVGDPDRCAGIVQQYEDVGCDVLVFGARSNTLPMSSVLRTTALFGREVVGRLDRDPQHLTTRNREAATR